MRYFLIRFGRFLIVFFVVTFGVMVLLRIGLNAPGDPARTMLGGTASQAQIDEVTARYHLDSNMLVQYFWWLKGMVTGDMGVSVQQNITVANYIKPRIMTTVFLGVYSIVLGLLIAIPLAVFQAYRRDSVRDRVASWFSFLFVAIPALVLGPLMIAVFVTWLGWFPRIGDKIYPWDDLGEHFHNFFLPTVILTMALAAVFTRLLRADMALTLQSDFITLASAKGVSPRRVLWRHALPELAVLPAHQRRSAARRPDRRRGHRRAAVRHEGHGLVARLVDPLQGPVRGAGDRRHPRDRGRRREPESSTCCTPSSTHGSARCGRWDEEDPVITLDNASLTSPEGDDELLHNDPEDFKPRRRIPIGAIIGVLWVVLLIVLTVLATYFPSAVPCIRDYDTRVKVNGKTTSYGLGPGWTAWWGLDKSSYDVFARCIYGAKVTLTIGIGATAIGLVVGGAIGIVAGYFRGWTDRVFSVIVDALLALPALLLALILVFRLDDLRDRYSWLELGQPGVVDHAHARHPVHRPARTHRARPDDQPARARVRAGRAQPRRRTDTDHRQGDPAQPASRRWSPWRSPAWAS